MLATEFLTAYPSNLPESQIHRGVDMPLVRDVQNYSYNYGLIVHAAMNDDHRQIPPLLPAITSFENSHTFNSVELALLETPGAWRHL